MGDDTILEVINKSEHQLHFQALQNEFANSNETILHFGNMENLNDGCKVNNVQGTIVAKT